MPAGKWWNVVAYRADPAREALGFAIAGEHQPTACGPADCSKPGHAFARVDHHHPERGRIQFVPGHELHVTHELARALRQMVRIIQLRAQKNRTLT